jgi:hypothetical protein
MNVKTDEWEDLNIHKPVCIQAPGDKETHKWSQGLFPEMDGETLLWAFILYCDLKVLPTTKAL